LKNTMKMGFNKQKLVLNGRWHLMTPLQKGLDKTGQNLI